MNELWQKIKQKFEPKATLGVDFGRRNIKAIGLRQSGEKVQLENIFMLDLADSNETFPEENHGEEKLKAAIEVHGLQNQRVSIAINDDSVESFLLNIPNMPEGEIYSVVENALETRIPYPVEEASYDFTILERSPQDKPDMLTVKVFFAMKNNVNQMLDHMDKAMIQPVKMDVNSLAIATMLEFNGYTQKGYNFIVVDMGENQTTTSLIMDHDVVFIRSVPFAYGSINQTLKEFMELTYADAEQLKVSLQSIEESELTDAQRVADQTYMHILDSIQETIDYYSSQTNDAPITGIYLTGGGATGDVREILENHYQIETTLVNPFRNLELFNGEQSEAQSIDAYSPFMATAVGLALRGIDW